MLLAAGAGCARTTAPPAPVPAPAITPPAESSPAAAEVPPAPPAPRTPVPAAASPLPPLPGGEDAAGAPGGPAGPIRLRVGLATDQSEVLLPCCGEQVVASWRGGSVALTALSRVRAGGSIAGRAWYRLQVAALRDEAQAEELALHLARRSSEPADTSFDAESGLYRVRLGRWESRPEAEAGRRRLAALGTPSAWVVSEGGELRDPWLNLVVAGRAIRVPGRWLTIERRESERVGGEEPGPEVGLEYGGGRYRGRVLVYLNDRGRLNVINDLWLEDYLRGVVPAEMGPELYPRLEALKAQAVAARTYTLRNLREFESEGFDICAAPRCQVYRGIAAEHPLSDRAIAATAGQVLIADGELVDARYSATCGGHTEDVEVVFPLETAHYLRGVPCVEGGLERLVGDLPVGEEWPQALTRRLFTAPAPAVAGSPRTRYAARLAGLAPDGAHPVGDRLASLQRGEVRRYLHSLFDRMLDAGSLAGDGDGPLSGPADERLGEVEAERLLYRLAVELGRIGSSTRYLRRIQRDGSGKRVLRLRDPNGGEESVVLPPRLATFRRRGELLLSGDLSVAPGDRLTVVRYGGQPVAVLQEVDPGAAAPDRGHPRRSWTRFRSDAEIARQVEERYPGLGFRGFEILDRGSSGRVRRLRLLGAGGETLDVDGLAVRWTLDLPDTLFTAERARSPRGERGYRFTGGGWGHGVGMCQVGAYAMAGRRLSYREILQHYYSDVALARVQRRARR